ncbi:hypothetical protein SAMN05444483_10783 [Salegentibacter echinorum]|uniref:Uncharacterized protein n=2 Tax=Salegentibacter echinorum TaxID=1073325 RepID=A0A1M5IC41_SALEC|nr:hypothetical protein SAMN05444483_10783 [Salegentibacter echinorum]
MVGNYRMNVPKKQNVRNVEVKMEISIFRTSVATETNINELRAMLDILVGAGNWNFDLEDVDNILRVNYPPHQNNFLANELRKYGFVCIELY